MSKLYPHNLIQRWISGELPTDTVQDAKIDWTLCELASSIYHVPSGTLNPFKLAEAVVNKLELRDEASVNYAYVEALLWHDTLETGCQLEGRQEHG